ncbi:MAG: hypothetical protein IJV62_04925 [Eggerthellaceae bacterium]|nr:hypothetical protein [Eggerthellaceae bacterium]
MSKQPSSQETQNSRMFSPLDDSFTSEGMEFSLPGSWGSDQQDNKTKESLYSGESGSPNPDGVALEVAEGGVFSDESCDECVNLEADDSFASKSIEDGQPKKNEIGKKQNSSHGETKALQTSLPKVKPWHLFIRHIKKIGALVIAVIIFYSAFLAWQQWFHYDDLADIQGTWETHDKKLQISLDDSHIYFPNNLTYQYHIHTWKKTLDVSFQDLSGSVAYEFKDERGCLVFTDEDENGLGSIELFRVAGPEKESQPSEQAVDNEPSFGEAA